MDLVHVLTRVRLHTNEQQLYDLSAKTKALDVVDDDVDYHYHGLKLTQPVIDPSSMKRVHRAQLPGRDAERLVEILGKIAAIAKSRQECVQELEAVKEQLRRSEFAKERAESMAKARGVALMKCQEALGDAEEQQVQLSGLLRSALEQLGVGDTRPMNTPYTNPSHHSSMRFRYSNITPPSGRRRPASSIKDTPMTGFTVYSNPVSEEASPDDFVTPARTMTYYSEDDDGEEGEYDNGTGGPTGHSGMAVSRGSIGAETAQKLAREVLPHLGSSEIAYLVEYNMKEKERQQDVATRETHPQQLQPQTAHNAQTKFKTKTSTFSVAGSAHDEGDGGFLIGTGVDQPTLYDGIPSVERRRNAAARIVAKLNERLPRELHITSLNAMDG